MFAACGGFDLSLLPRLKNKFLGVLAAEGKGFEPLVRGYRTTVFKTVTFGRSVNLPLPLSGNVTILEEIGLRSEVGSSVCFIPFGE